MAARTDLRLFSIPCWLSHTEILLCISFAINREIYGKNKTRLRDEMGQLLIAEIVTCSSAFRSYFYNSVKEQYG